MHHLFKTLRKLRNQLLNADWAISPTLDQVVHVNYSAVAAEVFSKKLNHPYQTTPAPSLHLFPLRLRRLLDFGRDILKKL